MHTLADMYSSHLSTRFLKLLISFVFIRSCTAVLSGVSLAIGSTITFFDPTNGYKEFQHDLSDGSGLICAIGNSDLATATAKSPNDGIFNAYYIGETEYKASCRFYCLGPAGSELKDLPENKDFFLSSCSVVQTNVKNVGKRITAFCTGPTHATK